MIGTWRLVKRVYQGSALTEEGARLYGGRWNSPGRAVVYTSGSLALAALEVLVHVKSQRELSHYQKLRLRLDESLVAGLEELPPAWRQGRASEATRALGDAWLERAETPVLRVPSVVIAEEWNYLLNPLHPQFHAITADTLEPFIFDERLRPI